MTLGSTQPASDVTGSSTCLNANACVPKKAPQQQTSALRRVLVQRACPSSSSTWGEVAVGGPRCQCTHCLSKYEVNEGECSLDMYENLKHGYLSASLV